MLHWLHLKGRSPETKPTGATVGTLLPAAMLWDNIPLIYPTRAGPVPPSQACEAHWEDGTFSRLYASAVAKIRIQQPIHKAESQREFPDTGRRSPPPNSVLVGARAKRRLTQASQYF